MQNETLVIKSDLLGASAIIPSSKKLEFALLIFIQVFSLLLLFLLNDSLFLLAVFVS